MLQPKEFQALADRLASCLAGQLENRGNRLEVVPRSYTEEPKTQTAISVDLNLLPGSKQEEELICQLCQQLPAKGLIRTIPLELPIGMLEAAWGQSSGLCLRLLAAYSITTDIMFGRIDLLWNSEGN